MRDRIIYIFALTLCASVLFTLILTIFRPLNEGSLRVFENVLMIMVGAVATYLGTNKTEL